MNAARSDSNTRPLETLGISADEERSYRILLARRLARADDIAPELGLTPRKTQRLLEALAAKGLATHSPERPRRYMPVLPEFAVEAIVSQRQAELERVRAAIPDLNKHAANARDTSERSRVWAGGSCENITRCHHSHTGPDVVPLMANRSAATKRGSFSTASTSAWRSTVGSPSRVETTALCSRAPFDGLGGWDAIGRGLAAVAGAHGSGIAGVAASGRLAPGATADQRGGGSIVAVAAQPGILGAAAV